MPVTVSSRLASVRRGKNTVSPFRTAYHPASFFGKHRGILPELLSPCRFCGFLSVICSVRAGSRRGTVTVIALTLRRFFSTLPLPSLSVRTYVPLSAPPFSRMSAALSISPPLKSRRECYIRYICLNYRIHDINMESQPEARKQQREQPIFPAPS